MRKTLLSFAAVSLTLLVGCASSLSSLKSEPVTLVLKNGDEIKAHVLDVFRREIIFEALDRRQAYEYGRVISAEQVKYVVLADGTRLSVRQYTDFMRGRRVEIAQAERDRREGAVQSTDLFEDPQYARLTKKDIGDMTEKEFRYLMMVKEAQRRMDPAAALPDPHYERLKKKDIADMTDNEFQYLMMMRELELRLAQQAKAKAEGLERAAVGEQVPPAKVIPEAPPKSSEPPQPPAPLKPVELPQPRPAEAFEAGRELAQLLIETGTAGVFLRRIRDMEARGETLTPPQAALVQAIEQSPRWAEKREELTFLAKAAEKALARAYLYTPDDLKEKLGLSFDPTVEMNFRDVMEQLRRRYDSFKNMEDFRHLVEVVGESGARAIQQLSENFDDWQFVTQREKSVTSKP